MANTLKFKRGLLAGLPTAAEGEPLFTTDTADLYIGTSTGNQRFQKYIASGATTQILRGDGSLYTFPLNISSPSNGQVLKYNGTAWVNDSDAGITGSLTTNYLPRATGSTTLGNSVIFQGTRALGINTATPVDFGVGTYNLHLHDDGIPLIHLTNSTTGQSSSVGMRMQANGNDLFFINSQASGIMRWNLVSTEAMRLTANRNLHIGTYTSDNGQRLQVIGDTLLKGSGTTSATTALTVQNSASSNIITVKNNRTTNIISDAGQLNISSSADATNGVLELDANSSNTQSVFVQLTRGTVGFATTSINQTGVRINGGFAPTSGTATWNTLHINPTINQTGGANGITRGLYVNPTLTSAADWRSIETSNNTGWSYYGAGSANSYFGGSVGIGNSSMFTKLNLRHSNTTVYSSTNSSTWLSGINLYNDSTAALNISNLISFYGSSNVNSVFGVVQNASGVGDFIFSGYNGSSFLELMRLTAGGRLGIGTVNPTSALDVIQIGGTAGISVSGGTNPQLRATDGTIATKVQTITGLAAYIGTETNHQLRLIVNNSPIFYLFTSTNVSVGSSSDTGEKLQVNGTMKVTGASTFGGNITLTTNNTYIYGKDNVGNIPRLLGINSGNSTYIGPIDAYAGGEILYAVSANVTNQRFYTSGSERMRITSGGNTILAYSGPDTGELLQVYGTIKVTGAATFSSTVTSTQYRLSALNTAPATASSTGTLGEIRIDADHIYVCTATNTWKRVAIATF